MSCKDTGMCKTATACFLGGCQDERVVAPAGPVFPPSSDVVAREFPGSFSIGGPLGRTIIYEEAGSTYHIGVDCMWNAGLADAPQKMADRIFNALSTARQAPTEDEFAKMMSDVNATHIACMMGNMIYNLSQKKGHILTDADCKMFSNLSEQWDAARQAPTEASHKTFNEFWASDAEHFEACGHSEDFARAVWHAANKDNT